MNADIAQEKAWERGWWWRCLKFAGFDKDSHRTRDNGHPYFRMWWSTGEEFTAWGYELARRAKPEIQLPPFYLLTVGQRNNIQNTLRACEISNPVIKMAGHGKPRPDFLLPLTGLAINLLAPQKEVLNYFKKLYTAERKCRGFHLTHDRRGLSWLWPESIDVFNLRLDGFDPKSAVPGVVDWSESIRKTKEKALSTGNKFSNGLATELQQIASPKSIAEDYSPLSLPVFQDADYFDEVFARAIVRN